MSKFVSPWPPVEIGDDYRPPADAAWWRLRLRPNADGFLYTQQVSAAPGEKLDESFSNAVLFECEIYDGHDTIVDVGFDRKIPSRFTEFGSDGRIAFLDVLYVGVPTPAAWLPLTKPGDQRHPEDETGQWWFRPVRRSA